MGRGQSQSNTIVSIIYLQFCLLGLCGWVEGVGGSMTENFKKHSKRHLTKAKISKKIVRNIQQRLTNLKRTQGADGEWKHNSVELIGMHDEIIIFYLLNFTTI